MAQSWEESFLTREEVLRLKEQKMSILRNRPKLLWPCFVYPTAVVRGKKKKNVRTKEVAASGTLSASNHLHLGDILCCLWVLLIVPLGEFLFHEFMQCSFEFMEMLSSLWWNVPCRSWDFLHWKTAFVLKLILNIFFGSSVLLFSSEQAVSDKMAVATFRC